MITATGLNTHIYFSPGVIHDQTNTQMSILKTSSLVVFEDTRKLTHYFGKWWIKGKNQVYIIFSVWTVPQSSQTVGEEKSPFINCLEMKEYENDRLSYIWSPSRSSVVANITERQISTLCVSWWKHLWGYFLPSSQRLQLESEQDLRATSLQETGWKHLLIAHRCNLATSQLWQIIKAKWPSFFNK